MNWSRCLSITMCRRHIHMWDVIDMKEKLKEFMAFLLVLSSLTFECLICWIWIFLPNQRWGGGGSDTRYDVDMCVCVCVTVVSSYNQCLLSLYLSSLTQNVKTSPADHQLITLLIARVSTAVMRRYSNLWTFTIFWKYLVCVYVVVMMNWSRATHLTAYTHIFMF